MFDNNVKEGPQGVGEYLPPPAEEIERRITAAMTARFPLRNPAELKIEIGGHTAELRIGTEELFGIYRTWYQRFFTEAIPEIEIEVTRHDVFEDGVFHDIHSGGSGDNAWIARWDFCALMDKRKRRVLALLRHDAPYFSTDAMLRIAFSTLLIDKGLLLVHGACVAVGDRAVLLYGMSQSGKSTAARAMAMDPGAQVFADDITALSFTASNVRVYSTPFWSLKEPDFSMEKVMRRNETLALCATLGRGEQVKLIPIPLATAATTLLPNIMYFGMDASGRSTVFDLAFRLCEMIPFFELRFPKDKPLLPSMRAQLGHLLP